MRPAITMKITVNMCLTQDGSAEFQDYPGPGVR